jgi:hypothetical protein
MNKIFIFIGVVFIGFTGCQPAATTLFYWGNYSSTLYDYKKNPSDTTLSVHKTTLLDIMTKAPEKGKKIPPGIYAEYGYILLKEGKETEGLDCLTKEEQTFPESKAFVQRLKDEYLRGKK